MEACFLISDGYTRTGYEVRNHGAVSLSPSDDALSFEARDGSQMWLTVVPLP